MNLDSLLISTDPALVGVLRPTLEKISVRIEVCPESQVGSDLLRRRKFDAIIIDCDDLPGGVDLLRSLRKTPSNSKAISFGVLHGKTTTQEAFECGANFVLQKPLSALQAARCFNAALNFMIRERRRYFRHPVEIPVRLGMPKGPALTASSTNLSEGGMAIRIATPLAKDTMVEARFTLPDSCTSLELKGQIAWADGSGQAGIHFIDVPQTAQYELDKWLSERLQGEMPSRWQPYLTRR
jgi:CheY-like chemotaxis protein